MTMLFLKIMGKYCELMVDDEHMDKRKKLRFFPLPFAFLMIARGVSENIFRTGSELVMYL